MGLVILTFDRLTLKLYRMRVASKVGNLPSKFRHARPLGSRIIRCVRDGRTGRRIYKTNTYCLSGLCPSNPGRYVCSV